METLEYRDKYQHERTAGSVLATEDRDEEDGNSPVRLYAPDRRSSKTLDPSYPTLPTPRSDKDDSKTANERRSVDLAYPDFSLGTHRRPEGQARSTFPARLIVASAKEDNTGRPRLSHPQPALYTPVRGKWRGTTKYNVSKET
jgi:hypothetical protein